jgi:hypothetical protein
MEPIFLSNEDADDLELERVVGYRFETDMLEFVYCEYEVIGVQSNGLIVRFMRWVGPTPPKEHPPVTLGPDRHPNGMLVIRFEK